LMPMESFSWRNCCVAMIYLWVTSDVHAPGRR
jgi:hypothetical protein